MQFVGREEERALLTSCLKQNSSRLVAVYGRRRIGKTFLIRNAFDNHILIDHTGLHGGTLAAQLNHFHQSLLKAGCRTATESPRSWMAAFSMLEIFLSGMDQKAKKIIFLDELPWMDTPRSGFLMAFENFWNSCCSRRTDMVVVICGSAASWMINNITRNKGGLHNRVTEKINLKAFSLRETEIFLKAKGVKWTRYDMVQLYMITGGIPFYLDQVHKGESVAQFTDRVCFTENGALYSEFNDLFASLFDRSTQHYSVIGALAKVKSGLDRNQLLKKSEMPSGGGLTRITDELLASGFITKQLTLDGNTNKAIYRISDPFILFYYQFMHHTKTFGRGSWLKKAVQPQWISWTGLAFETVCMLHSQQILKALQLTAVYTEISTWRGKHENEGAQADLVIERADRIIHICEAKFSKAPFTIDKKYAGELRKKTDIFSQQKEAKGKSIFLTMITTYGVTENGYKQELVQNELTMDDLFL